MDKFFGKNMWIHKTLVAVGMAFEIARLEKCPKSQDLVILGLYSKIQQIFLRDSKVLFILFGQHGRTALSRGPGYSASAFSSGKGILHNPIADPWHPQSKRKSIQEPLPSRELTYPPDKAYLKMMFLFPQVGYDNFLEGI